MPMKDEARTYLIKQKIEYKLERNRLKIDDDKQTFIMGMAFAFLLLSSASIMKENSSYALTTLKGIINQLIYMGTPAVIVISRLIKMLRSTLQRIGLTDKINEIEHQLELDIISEIEVRANEQNNQNGHAK